MTSVKKFRLIALGDAKRLTKGVLPGSIEFNMQPTHNPPA